MSTITKRKPQDIEYPTSDGKPVAETDWHRNLMVDLINRLDRRYAADPDVYVSGNLLLFYERGNKRKHVSPDTFVVFGVVKKQRPNYLLWREKKAPSFIMEFTSSTTKKEDKTKKFVLYRDVLKAKEYFQFDPFGDYLDPPLQGFRWERGDFVPIIPINGRLPSETLGLHLEAFDGQLLLWDPAAKEYLRTDQEEFELLQNDRDEIKRRAQREKQRADRAELENLILQKENERLRERLESRKNGH